MKEKSRSQRTIESAKRRKTLTTCERRGEDKPSKTLQSDDDNDETLSSSVISKVCWKRQWETREILNIL